MSRWLKFSIGLLPHLWFAKAQYVPYCRNLYLPRIFKAITPVPSVDQRLIQRPFPRTICGSYSLLYVLLFADYIRVCKAHSSCHSPLNYLHDSFLSVWSISNLGNSIPQMQSNWPNEEYITSTTGGIKKTKNNKNVKNNLNTLQ